MKKIVGYIFLVIGVLLGLSLMSNIPKALKDFLDKSKTGTTHDNAYMIGIFVGFLLVAGTAFLCIRFGLKWISKKPVVREVDDIGRT